MRYAIYFCPAADTALGQLGHHWLAASPHAPELSGISTERRNALLIKARRYGWHATIRAPFTPLTDVAYDDMRRAVISVARVFEPLELRLHLHRLAGFLALRPDVDDEGPRHLAAACLEALMPLCTPLSNEVLLRRSAGLDADEINLLRNHGYPYVMERYRFHLTLSAPATEAEESIMRQWLTPRVAELPSTRLDALSICREVTPGGAFEWVERIPLHTADREHTA